MTAALLMVGSEIFSPLQPFEEIAMRTRAQALTWFIAIAAALVVRGLLPIDTAAAAAADDGIVRVQERLWRR